MSPGGVFATLPSGPYDVAYADPPWSYYGSATKNAAAGKHYDLLTNEELRALPLREILSEKAVLFLWATCPRLDAAVDIVRDWGLHFRGVAYVWVKTRIDGVPMGARGVPPTFVKPTTELVIAATTMKRGRPFPILDFKQTQTVFAPVGKHSQKPTEVRDRIVALCGERPRIELFARGRIDAWDSWGLEAE